MSYLVVDKNQVKQVIHSARLELKELMKTHEVITSRAHWWSLKETLTCTRCGWTDKTSSTYAPTAIFAHKLNAAAAEMAISRSRA